MRNKSFCEFPNPEVRMKSQFIKLSIDNVILINIIKRFIFLLLCANNNQINIKIKHKSNLNKVITRKILYSASCFFIIVHILDMKFSSSR